MNITVIGSHLCPDTLYALNRLSEAKAEIDFKNLSASLSDLKAYLALRESDPVYADIRENGGIGIPCFILEDGTVTRDLETVLKSLEFRRAPHPDGMTGKPAHMSRLAFSAGARIIKPSSTCGKGRLT